MTHLIRATLVADGQERLAALCGTRADAEAHAELLCRGGLWRDARILESKPPVSAWPRKSVHGICSKQLRRAEQAAVLRRITPDAFDQNGTIIPSEAARAWHNYLSANPNRAVVL